MATGQSQWWDALHTVGIGESAAFIAADSPMPSVCSCIGKHKGKMSWTKIWTHWLITSLMFLANFMARLYEGCCF